MFVAHVALVNHRQISGASIALDLFELLETNLLTSGLCPRDKTEGLDGQFQVPHHRREVVVEVVGDGPGHTPQSFSLLKLPVLGLEVRFFFLLQLALGDVADHRAPYRIAIGVLRRSRLHSRPEGRRAAVP